VAVNLLNVASGSIETVEDAVVRDLVLAGTHQALGDSIGVMTEGGESYDVPVAKFREALSIPGVTYDSPEMRKQREFVTSGSGNLAAIAAGAARGLSFSVSDYMLTLAGGKESAKALQEESPWLSMLGEAGVIAAAIYFGGPIGAVSKAGQVVKLVGTAGRTLMPATKTMKAARAIGFAPRMAAETGARVGRWTQKMMHPIVKDSKVRTFLGNRVSQGVATAIEASPYAVGAVTFGQSLEDDPLTMEQAASAVGTTMALGGVLGAAIGSGTLKSMRQRELPGQMGSLTIGDKILKVAPFLSPKVAAMKSALDLTEAQGKQLEEKIGRLMAAEAAEGTALKAGELTTQQAYERIGEIMMDDNFWAEVQRHFAGSRLKPVSTPIQGFGTKLRFKTQQEFADAFADAQVYLLDKMDGYMKAADTQDAVVKEMGRIEAEKLAQYQQYEEVLGAYNQRMRDLGDEEGILTVAQLQHVHELKSAQAMKAAMDKRAKSLRELLGRKGEDIYRGDGAAHLAESFDALREANLSASEWETMGLILKPDGTIERRMLDGVSTQEIKSGADLIAQLGEEGREIIPLEKSIIAAQKAYQKQEKAFLNSEKKLLAKVKGEDTAVANQIKNTLREEIGTPQSPSSQFVRTPMSLVDEANYVDKLILDMRQSMLDGAVVKVPINDPEQWKYVVRGVEYTLEELGPMIKQAELDSKFIRNAIAKAKNKAMYGEGGVGGYQELLLKNGMKVPAELPQVPEAYINFASFGKPEHLKLFRHQRSAVSPAAIMRKRLATVDTSIASEQQQAIGILREMGRTDKARLAEIKMILKNEAPPVFQAELPVPAWNIDYRKIAGQMRKTAQELKKKGLTQESEREAYETLITQADRMDGLQVSGFREANNLKQTIAKNINWGKKWEAGAAGEMRKLRQLVRQEIDDKLAAVFVRNHPDYVPGMDAAAISRVRQEALAHVAEWNTANKMYGVMVDMTTFAKDKMRKKVGTRIQLRNPWIWGTLIGMGTGHISPHALAYLTGGLGIHFMNAYGEQAIAQMMKSRTMRNGFRRTAASTERSMDDAIDSLFSKKDLFFKTARYHAYLAGVDAIVPEGKEE